MVLVPGDKADAFLQAVNATAEELRREYKAVAANLKISVEETRGPANGLVVSRDVTDKFIQVLVLSPNGISEMNAAVPGVVQSSDNLGEIRLEREQNRLVVVYESVHPSGPRRTISGTRSISWPRWWGQLREIRRLSRLAP